MGGLPGWHLAVAAPAAVAAWWESAAERPVFLAVPRRGMGFGLFRAAGLGPRPAVDLAVPADFPSVYTHVLV